MGLSRQFDLELSPDLAESLPVSFLFSFVGDPLFPPSLFSFLADSDDDLLEDDLLSVT